MKNQVVPPLILLLASLGLLLILITLLWFFDPKESAKLYLRILGALCASGISVGIPGIIKINDGTETKTLAETTPKITASGAIAVFVFVYLFDPVN